MNSLTHKDSGNSLIQVSEIMCKVGQELTDSARVCLELQWLISSMLERAHPADLPDELHLLQDIDRLHQTLSDLASLVSATEASTNDVLVPVHDLSMNLKLDSLHQRLFGFVRNAPHNSSNVEEEVDITWL